MDQFEEALLMSLDDFVRIRDIVQELQEDKRKRRSKGRGEERRERRGEERREESAAL